MVWQRIFTHILRRLFAVILVSYRIWLVINILFWFIHYIQLSSMTLSTLMAIDVVVHRLLAACINPDERYGSELTDKLKMKELCDGSINMYMIFSASF